MLRQEKWDNNAIKREIYFGDQKKILEELREIKVGYKETIRLEVEKAYGEKIKEIDKIYKEIIFALKILREKGLITREEMAEKYKSIGDQVNA